MHTNPFRNLITAARTAVESGDTTSVNEFITITTESFWALDQALVKLGENCDGSCLAFTLQWSPQHPSVQGKVNLSDLPLHLGISLDEYETCAGGKGDAIVLLNNFHGGEPTIYLWSDRHLEESPRTNAT